MAFMEKRPERARNASVLSFGMANPRQPRAQKVPSLLPAAAPSTSRRNYASGEYPAGEYARGSTTMFESEMPARPSATFELGREGPISETKHGAPPSSREMDGADFEDFDEFDNDDNTPSSVLELQMDGLPIREEAWPKPAPARLVGDIEERSVAPAIPPPPPAALRRPTTPAAHAATTTNFLRAADTKAVIAAFAGYGAPPTSLWQTPGYALHVFRRRRELAQDLAYARRGRSPDVALFEAAIDAYDSSSASAGKIILGALVFAFVALSVAALVLI